MRVDIVDIFSLHISQFERLVDGKVDTHTVGSRLCHVMRITRRKSTQNFRYDRRATLERALQGLENEHTGTFTHDKTVTIRIPRSGGSRGIVVRTQRLAARIQPYRRE